MLADDVTQSFPIIGIHVHSKNNVYDMSRRMGKPTICIGENKGADQLRSDCEADQRLCFRYKDSTRIGTNPLCSCISWLVSDMIPTL